MFRRVLVMLASALLIAGLNTSPAHASEVFPEGAAFNQPLSPDPADRNNLMRQIKKAIYRTPTGHTIRIASYSNDRKDIVDALIHAHRRGVSVQVVLNDNWTSSQTTRLMKALGSNIQRRSFVVECEGSCRGGAGNLHLKVFAFTRTGDANNVVMTGSTNLTARAAKLQWNDLVTLPEATGLHNTFVQIFDQLKMDSATAPRWVYYEEPGLYDAQFYRTRGTSYRTSGDGTRVYSRMPGAEEDPVMQRLRAVSCAAAPGTGYNGRTLIRIAMYGWNGDRGIWLAEQVARLKRNGCDIKVIVSSSGGRVVRTLREARIPVRSADYKHIWTADGRRIIDFYSHLKFMAINGTYQGKATRAVWTGSENWSDMSFRNDELTVGLSGARWQRLYTRHFGYLYKKYTHRLGIFPTQKPPYVG